MSRARPRGLAPAAAEPDGGTARHDRDRACSRGWQADHTRHTQPSARMAVAGYLVLLACAPWPSLPSVESGRRSLRSQSLHHAFQPLHFAVDVKSGKSASKVFRYIPQSFLWRRRTRFAKSIAESTLASRCMPTTSARRYESRAAGDVPAIRRSVRRTVSERESRHIKPAPLQNT